MHWKYVAMSGGLVVLCALGAIAEPYLVIHRSNGSNVRVPIADIRKITFDNAAVGTGKPKNFAMLKKIFSVIKVGNDFVNIEYTMKQRGNVNIEIFNLQGRCVRVLASGVEPAGTHRISWNFLQDSGKRAVAGSYIARVLVDGVPFSRSLCIVQ